MKHLCNLVGGRGGYAEVWHSWRSLPLCTGFTFWSCPLKELMRNDYWDVKSTGRGIFRSNPSCSRSLSLHSIILQLSYSTFLHQNAHGCKFQDSAVLCDVIFSKQIVKEKWCYPQQGKPGNRARRWWIRGSQILINSHVRLLRYCWCVSTSHSLSVQRTCVAQMFCHAECHWVLTGNFNCFLAHRPGR